MKRFIIFLSIFLILLIGFLYYQYVLTSSTYYFGGYDASNEPIQENLTNAEPFLISTSRLKLQLHPLAKYEITAKVQSKQRYVGDWSAKISPFDFALAWGELVDRKLDKFIKYSQTSRFYMYRYKPGTPLSQKYISEHSANTHIIPATKNIRKALFKVRKKQIVKMEGYLVRINGTYKKGTVSWNSSTIRTDTGNGACEVMYVTKLYYKNKMYE
jgi:hypothetical protein